MNNLSFSDAQATVRNRYPVHHTDGLDAIAFDLPTTQDTNILKAIGQALQARADDGDWQRLSDQDTPIEDLRGIVSNLVNAQREYLTTCAKAELQRSPLQPPAVSAQATPII